MLGVVWSANAVPAREELKQAAPDLWLLAGLADPLPRLRVIRRKAPQVLVHVLVADTAVVGEATVGDRAFDFSRREIEILSVLCSKPGEWVSREQVLDTVLEKPAKQGSSLLRTHILNIRRKLGPQEWLVQTDRSHGVMLALAAHERP